MHVKAYRGGVETMSKQIYISDDIEMYRDDDKLVVNIKAKSPIKIWKGKRPIVKELTTLVIEGDAGEYTLDMPVGEMPCYFLLESDGKKEIFAERKLPLKGAINVRDIGGYKTNDGKRVKWGLLFRGDQLSKLEQSDIELLQRIGIKTIIDYRSDHERMINPNVKLDTVIQDVHSDPHSSFSEAAAQAVDLASENMNLVNDLNQGKVESKYINGKGLKVILSYENLVDSEKSKTAYKKVLETYANPNLMPSIQHCRGGKDRTGFGSMLLLMLLGVRDEDIVRDYVMTGVIREERNNFKLSQYKELTDNQDYLDYLMSMIETRAEYIEASMNRINHEYGGIENYVKDVLGIHDFQIDTIRESYLEEM